MMKAEFRQFRILIALPAEGFFHDPENMRPLLMRKLRLLLNSPLPGCRNRLVSKAMLPPYLPKVLVKYARGTCFASKK